MRGWIEWFAKGLWKLRRPIQVIIGITALFTLLVLWQNRDVRPPRTMDDPKFEAAANAVCLKQVRPLAEQQRSSGDEVDDTPKANAVKVERVATKLEAAVADLGRSTTCPETPPDRVVVGRIRRLHRGRPPLRRGAARGQPRNTEGRRRGRCAAEGHQPFRPRQPPRRLHSVSRSTTRTKRAGPEGPALFQYSRATRAAGADPFDGLVARRRADRREESNNSGRRRRGVLRTATSRTSRTCELSFVARLPTAVALPVRSPTSPSDEFDAEASVRRDLVATATQGERELHRAVVAVVDTLPTPMFKPVFAMPRPKFRLSLF